MYSSLQIGSILHLRGLDCYRLDFRNDLLVIMMVVGSGGVSSMIKFFLAVTVKSCQLLR